MSIPVARSEVPRSLFAKITALPGIGSKTARTLKRLNIETVSDLLFLLPHSVVDRRLRDDLMTINPGEIVTVRIRILEHREGSTTRQPYSVIVEGGGKVFELVFFHARTDWIRRLLPVGEVRIVSGKIKLFDGCMQIPHPDFVITEEEMQYLPSFEPVYPLTHGITQKILRKMIQAALVILPDLLEWQSSETLQEFGWPKWADALRMLHAPTECDTLVAKSLARERLAYDELLAHQLALGLIRARMRYGGAERAIQVASRLTGQAKDAFGFSPTNAQVRALKEIEADMAAPTRMLRLLQGDVGSGKTWVAMLAMLVAVESGSQAALMIPTEILARQHASSLGRIAKQIGVNLILLTGQDSGENRRDKLMAIKGGSAQIIIGTHTLFQKEIAFHDLRLVVVDEQHRFGVHQRMELADKAPAGADLLVMTATPIPRTLALAEYGNLDFSILEEKPPERRPVETRLVSRERYEEILNRLSRALSQGSRVYWICPLVRERGATNIIAAEERHRSLATRLGAKRVALIHGQMSDEKKNTAMCAFRNGEAQLLVATTIIEAGINIPDATIIVIENAEKFGLSQLHQLRGRVGRGTERCFCLLLYDPPLGEIARSRLEIMRTTEDGFYIAEEDMRIRGPGDFIGTAQSGTPKFQIAQLNRDSKLMERARAEARSILQKDPTLTSPHANTLKKLLCLMRQDVF